MNTITGNSEFNGKRLLDVVELCNYLGIGRNRAKEFARSIGADRHYGRRVVYDRVIIDRAIDSGAPWQPAIIETATAAK